MVRTIFSGFRGRRDRPGNAPSLRSTESALQRNWRPFLMCCVGILLLHNYVLWPYVVMLGATVAPPEIPERLWSLLEIGVGGYVIGRSAEKGIKEWKRV